MPSVVRALMHLGLTRTAEQPLTTDKVELATKLIVEAPDDFLGGTTGRIRKPGLTDRPASTGRCTRARATKPASPQTFLRRALRHQRTISLNDGAPRLRGHCRTLAQPRISILSPRLNVVRESSG